jgi:type II secretory pathway predicted ATPase ExeA
MSRILARRAFGLPADPWSALSLRTADQARVDELVRATIRTRDRTGRRTPPAMIQVLGPRGAGKTRAVAEALTASTTTDRQGAPEPLHRVDVLRLQKERVTISDIEMAILTDLPLPGGERPANRGEIRTRQLARCLGLADRTGPVVLVLEETHRLHRSTLSALKSMRELRHASDDRLLGIIMIGQRDTLGSIAEIGLRSDSVQLEGLLATEIDDAIGQAIGQRCTPEARAVFCQSGDCRNWLTLQDRIDHAIAIARAAGHTQIEQTDAARATHSGLRELAQSAGVTNGEIARHLTDTTGRRVSDSQVSRLVSGERTDPDAQARITAFLVDRVGAQPPASRVVGGAA